MQRNTLFSEMVVYIVVKPNAKGCIIEKFRSGQMGVCIQSRHNFSQKKRLMPFSLSAAVQKDTCNVSEGHIFVAVSTARLLLSFFEFLTYCS